MGKLEDQLKSAVDEGKVPHAVVYATNADGSFTYHHAVGANILGKPDPIPEDALFMLASQTKLLASISALQTVEKGLIGLDEDVAKHLPELAEQPILKGFGEDDKPILEKRETAITLRHLLTHTSGLSYDAGHPDLIKLQQQRSHIPGSGSTVLTRFTYPLVFEPGTNWLYGCGIDWAGKLVERLTDMSLEEHMKNNILAPLGIKNITYFPSEHDMSSKIPALTVRTPDGKLVLNTEPTINSGVKDCLGGQGAYATLGDYIKVLQSILANDGKLLKPDMVDEMFKPQLGEGAKKGLNAFRAGPYGVMVPGENDPKIEADWGLGGIIFMADDDGRRKKGTLHWGGMTNPIWSIDREAGLAYTFGTQVLPPGDRPTAETITVAEKGIYELAGIKF